MIESVKEEILVSIIESLGRLWQEDKIPFAISILDDGEILDGWNFFDWYHLTTEERKEFRQSNDYKRFVVVIDVCDCDSALETIDKLEGNGHSSQGLQRLFEIYHPIRLFEIPKDNLHKTTIEVLYHTKSNSIANKYIINKKFKELYSSYRQLLRIKGSICGLGHGQNQ